MGGFNTGGDVSTNPVALPENGNMGGKPGATFQPAGGIGSKPGGTAPGAGTGTAAGAGNPAWSPTSAESLLQSNMNQVAPGSHPLNPVPSWYTGSQMFRGMNHPDPLIGRGRMQSGFHSMRNLIPNRPPVTQATPAPGSPAANNNPVAS